MEQHLEACRKAMRDAVSTVRILAQIWAQPFVNCLTFEKVCELLRDSDYLLIFNQHAVVPIPKVTVRIHIAVYTEEGRQCLIDNNQYTLMIIRKWISFPITVIKIISHILQFNELLPVLPELIINLLRFDSGKHLAILKLLSHVKISNSRENVVARYQFRKYCEYQEF